MIAMILLIKELKIALILNDIAWLEFTSLMDSKISKDKVIESALELSTDISDKDVKNQCQTILLSLALKFNIEISDELGRKIRMSPLGQKIFNEGIEEGKIEKQREIARNLLDVLNDQMIAKKCDLSLEEVKQLRKEYENKKQDMDIDFSMTISYFIY